MPDALANQICADGFAQRIPPVTPPPPPRAIESAEDRMIRRGDTTRKTTHRDG